MLNVWPFVALNIARVFSVLPFTYSCQPLVAGFFRFRFAMLVLHVVFLFRISRVVLFPAHVRITHVSLQQSQQGTFNSTRPLLPDEMLTLRGKQ